MELVIIGCFAGLFITHAAAVYAGWKMGCQRSYEYHVPVSKAEKSEPYQPIDEIDQERLDWK
jgi:hypothetical protein